MVIGGMAGAFFLDKPPGAWTKIGIAVAGLALGRLCVRPPRAGGHLLAPHPGLDHGRRSAGASTNRTQSQQTKQYQCSLSA